MEFSSDKTQINRWLTEVREFRRIQDGLEPFPLDNVFDVRASVARIRLEGTHMEEDELFDLKRSLETIIAVVKASKCGRSVAKWRNTTHLPYPLCAFRWRGNVPSLGATHQPNHR